MSDTFDELIATSRAEAAKAGWLGSAQHRLLLEHALPSLFGLSNWTLQWLPPGTPSFTESVTKTIGLERITSETSVLEDDAAAEYVALAFLHEALHARHSTGSGSYKAKKAAATPAAQPVIEYMYQRIEDARVMRLAVFVDASLAPHVLKFHDEGLRQREAQYHADHGADPWTVAPASQRNQLALAIERRLFRVDETLTLAPKVVDELAACEATIAPVWAGTTETSGLAAIAVVQRIMNSKLPT